MDKFCGECGTEIVIGEQRCRNCGHAFKQVDTPALPQRTVGKKSEVLPPPEERRTPQPPPASKKKLTQGQKIIRGTVGVLLVLIIGFSMWATSTHSAESIEKQFNDAIAAKDADKMSKLAVHEDGSSIKVSEAKALLKLLKAEGKGVVRDYSTVVPHKKFLGIYSNHKIELIDQYAMYDEFIDALDFKFNKMKIAEYKRNDEVVVFGPMSPGIYDVEAIFEGQYGSTSNAVSVKLMNTQHDEQWMDLDLSIANVVFEIEYHGNTGLKDAFILVNDEKFAVDEDGVSEEVGPFLIDGSQKVTAKMTAPWGEVSSVETAVDSEYVTMELTVIEEEHYKKIVDALAKYGEEYAEASSLGDVGKFTTLSKKGKETLEIEFIRNVEDSTPFSGKFKKLKVDKESLLVVINDDSKEIEIMTQFIYDVQNGDKTFDEFVSQESIILTYNKDKDAWFVDHIYRTDFGEFVATDEVEGSGTLYESTVQNDADLEDALSYFMSDYHDSSVLAINERDFSYVENYHTTTGKSLKEARDYLGYLETKGITEEHISTELEKFEQLNDSTWKVTTIDEYTIIKDGTSKYKMFRTVSLLKKVGGNLKMDELLSTEEI